MEGSELWPLAGVRVLDLSTEIAGPYCGKLLVDAGADVIKIEPPGDGDPLRRWTASGTPLPADEDGALFQYLNASKRSIALDLESPAGRDRLLELAGTADLVIESHGPGRLDALGVGYGELAERSPALSLVSISPWGADGPWADRPSTEFTVQAGIGTIAYRGLKDRMPVAAGGRLGEWGVGSFAAMGAMFAWLSARNTGEGQHVDASMFEAMVLAQTVYHDLNSQWFEGKLGRSIEMPSVEPARDGWIGFCTITGQQWTDFCSMLGHQEIAQDERYLDAKKRLEDFDKIRGMIHGWTRERTIDEIIEIATLIRIPVAPVGNGKTLPEMDQMVARGVFEDAAGGFVQPRPPYQLSKTPLRPLGAPPRLNEHEAEILQELPEARAKLAERRDGDDGPALPLTGLRVVDLTAFWAGPITTSFLSDMGADVIKIESIHRPDGMRFAGAVPNDRMWEWSPVFHGANAGKRDITLQLDDAEGLALVKRLIAKADVLVENYSARVMEKFGLGWDEVSEINPRIVMLRLPAFGLSGPWRDRPGFAMTVEQVSGMAWITGYEDLPLVPRGTCDPLGGVHATFALMMALEHRRRTGEGQLVELPLVEVAINLSAEQVLEHSAYGQLLVRDENRGPVAAPQGVYPCLEADRLLALAVATDSHWEALVDLMGRPAWTQDAALAEAGGRRAQHDAIDQRLTAWLADQSLDEAVARLLDAGIPASEVINAHDLSPHPQLEHRAFFQVMEHPVTGSTRYPGLPLRFSRLPRGLHRSPPPMLGEHNESVLREELGLDDEDIRRLREKRIIGERPSFM